MPHHFFTNFQNMETNSVPNWGLWLKTVFFMKQNFRHQKFMIMNSNSQLSHRKTHHLATKQ